MALFLVIAALCALAVVFLAAAPGAAGEEPPAPDPSPSYDPSPPPPDPDPSPSATPTPPASSATVAAARKARHQALDAWERNRRARSCFRVKAMKLPPQLPPRSASEETWKRALQRQLRATAQLRGENAERRRLMKHPGGSSNGVRWKPLARWVGWPESSLGMLAYVIMRESSGRPNALNAASLCAGLLQMHPGWYRGHWGHPAFDPFDPEENLTAGLWVWKRQGWRPWAL